MAHAAAAPAEALGLAAGAGIEVVNATQMPWARTSNPGIWMREVRRDDGQGTFLGMIRFDADARSGMHQHRGVATSFVVDGSLADYQGSVKLHEVGINVRGSTHDAIAYQQTVLVSRLEGPVLYLEEDVMSGVHAGSRLESFSNDRPDVLPDLNVPVDALAKLPTGIEGCWRQVIFDYADTGTNHRMVQLSLRPGTVVEFEATAPIDFWVRGGQIFVNRVPANGGCFVSCRPGVRAVLHAPFGCLLLAWAEGRERSAGNLFGF